MEKRDPDLFDRVMQDITAPSDDGHVKHNRLDLDWVGDLPVSPPTTSLEDQTVFPRINGNEYSKNSGSSYKTREPDLFDRVMRDIAAPSDDGHVKHNEPEEDCAKNLPKWTSAASIDDHAESSRSSPGATMNYLWTGLVPNLTSALFLHNGLYDVANENWAGAAWSFGWMVFSGLVGYHKFTEYKKVKRALEKHGWDSRIVKPKAYSFCQRHAARQAAKQIGYVEEFDKFMKEEGHRWYHFLPKANNFVR